MRSWLHASPLVLSSVLFYPNLLLSCVFLCLQFPEFYSFPPFFTIQPVLATKEKQLALWRDLIVRYHMQYKLKNLVVHECPLWKNEDIGRSLDKEAMTTIMDDLVLQGYGEWVDIPEPNRAQKQHTNVLSMKQSKQ